MAHPPRLRKGGGVIRQSPLHKILKLAPFRCAPRSKFITSPAKPHLAPHYSQSKNWSEKGGTKKHGPGTLCYNHRKRKTALLTGTQAMLFRPATSGYQKPARKAAQKPRNPAARPATLIINSRLKLRRSAALHGAIFSVRTVLLAPQYSAVKK